MAALHLHTFCNQKTNEHDYNICFYLPLPWWVHINCLLLEFASGKRPSCLFDSCPVVRNWKTYGGYAAFYPLAWVSTAWTSFCSWKMCLRNFMVKQGCAIHGDKERQHPESYMSDSPILIYAAFFCFCFYAFVCFDLPVRDIIHHGPFQIS